MHSGQRCLPVPAQEAAHFLMKLMFCMFAEDIGLLPPKLFNRLLTGTQSDPPRLAERMRKLFQAMAAGDDFGAEAILRFNGGLFADADVIELKPDEIRGLISVNDYDWASVEPSIFGTLFERTLDPAKRSQIGAHYTSREDILTLLEPVVMTPLRREWSEARDKCDKLWPKIQAAAARSGAKARPAKESADRRKFDRLLLDFDERLAHVTILDPACGSGNFLYVAINLLLDLEKEVITYAAAHGASLLPKVRPTQLAGIEINPYAQQLAQVVIWIGYLQWMHDNGFNAPANPVLEPIESIRLMDAIVDGEGKQIPAEPKWPDADYIVGNPPFLGGNKIRFELGDEYVGAVFRIYEGRVPAVADLCCYWFEKARDMIRRGRCQRAGLLATQGIRGGANRKVLEEIKKTGDIFFGVSDRDWILDGATVHVSMVGFDNRREKCRTLDGKPVATIHANLTAAADVTQARRLAASTALCFMGPSKKAAGYEAPFEYVSRTVKPERVGRREARISEFWWRFGRPRVELREAMRGRQAFLATPAVGKHRVFVRVPTTVLPDQQLLVFPRSDDCFLGIAQSRIHEVWSLAQGTQVRERESGFRYTPTTCFETFPLPEPTEAQASAIAEAAKELDQLRSAWLNPPEWTRDEVLEFPGTLDGPWSRYVHAPDARGIGLVRYPRLIPRDAEYAAQLAKRTLTNPYNQRPSWLHLAHRRLDSAVFAAYAWPEDLGDDELLARLLELNLAGGTG